MRDLIAPKILHNIPERCPISKMMRVKNSIIPRIRVPSFSEYFAADFDFFILIHNIPPA